MASLSKAKFIVVLLGNFAQKAANKIISFALRVPLACQRLGMRKLHVTQTFRHVVGNRRDRNDFKFAMASCSTTQAPQTYQQHPHQ